MTATPNLFVRFLKQEEGGATAIEYGLIMALMVIGLVAAMSSVGTETNASFQRAADSYPTNP